MPLFVRDAVLPLPRLHRPLAHSSPIKTSSLPTKTRITKTPMASSPISRPINSRRTAPAQALTRSRFFFPIVGLILYLVWKNQKPRCAHAIGKWALIGFVANIVLTIIGIVLSVLFYSVAAPSYYDFGSYNDIVYGMSMAIHMLAH